MYARVQRRKDNENSPNGLEYSFVKWVEWNKFILQVFLLNNLYENKIKTKNTV